MHRTPVMLVILLLSSGACGNDLVGQASVVDGDTLEVHGTRIRLWVSMPLRAASYAEVRTATYIAVARRQRMISIPSSRVGGSIVRRSPKINMGGLWQPVPSAVPISQNGLCAMVSRSIGRNIRKASTPPPNARPTVRAAGCGQAAMWSRGCFAAASGRVVLRPTVRMMQTHILERAVLRRLGASTVERAKSMSE